MLLKRINDGIEAAKSNANEGLEAICHSFLGIVNPDAGREAICSLAGGIDMKMRGLMDNLYLDDFSDVVNSLKAMRNGI